MYGDKTLTIVANTYFFDGMFFFPLWTIDLVFFNSIEFKNKNKGKMERNKKRNGKYEM